MELKKSLVDGGLGCVRFVMSLKLLLELARCRPVVRSADVAAAGCVVAMDAIAVVVFSMLVALKELWAVLLCHIAYLPHC